MSDQWARTRRRARPDLRDAYIRELDADGISVTAIATAVRLNRATVYRVLDRDRSAAPTTTDVFEAGLAWYAYYGSLPTATAWNRTLAAETVEGFVRWRIGWVPPTLPGTFRNRRRWPHVRHVVACFGGFPYFKEYLHVAIEALERIDDAYEPTSIPDWQVRALETVAPLAMAHAADRHEITARREADQALRDAEFLEIIAEVDAELDADPPEHR